MTRYWFKPKTYGYGATPISWEGWALTLAGALAPMVAWFVIRYWVPGPLPLTVVVGLWLAFVAVDLLVLIMVAKSKTEGGWKWRWGRE